MLKTSSTKSAKPKKGVVGIGGGSKNKAEPVSNHMFNDGSDSGDDGSHDDEYLS